MLLERRRGRPRLQPRQGDENVRAHPNPRPGRRDVAGVRGYPANGAISVRASDTVSIRPIAANSPSTLASDSDRTAFRAQSRNFASNWASVSGFAGDPMGSLASTVT